MQLNRLTVEILKGYCDQEGLHVGGGRGRALKRDYIDAINSHLNLWSTSSLLQEELIDYKFSYSGSLMGNFLFLFFFLIIFEYSLDKIITSYSLTILILRLLI